jgi:hypothetical protein
MTEEKFRRAKNDAERCQTVVNGKYQCYLAAMPGQKNCICHGGVPAHVNSKAVYNFRKEQFNARYRVLRDSEALKSLREEIALLRFLINKIIDNEGTPSKLLYEVTLLAQTSAEIESKLDKVIGKNNILSLITVIIERIELTDELIADFCEFLDSLYSSAPAAGTQNYEFRRWKNEIKAYLSEARIIDLRDEIGVSRLLLEETINRCSSEAELLIESNNILHLVRAIHSAVKVAAKLDAQAGMYLDQQQSLNAVNTINAMLTKHLSPEQLVEVANALERNFNTKPSSTITT